METRGSIPAPIPWDGRVRSVESMNIVAAVAVIAFVLYRQLQPRLIKEDRFWLIPVVIAGIGISQGGVVDQHHLPLSVGLIVVEAFAALALAFYRAYTVRVWRDERGLLWGQGTWQTVVAWIVSIAVRIGLVGAGMLMGVTQGEGGILVFLGLTLLVQNAVVTWRARDLSAAERVTVNA